MRQLLIDRIRHLAAQYPERFGSYRFDDLHLPEDDQALLNLFELVVVIATKQR